MSSLVALLIGVVLALTAGVLMGPADLPAWLPVVEFLALFAIMSGVFWLFRKFGILMIAVNPFVLMVICIAPVLFVSMTAMP